MKKRKIIILFVVITILCCFLISSSSVSADEISNCKKVTGKFLNYLKWGGTANGAKKYCNLPLKDYFKREIPYYEFIKAIKQRLQWGWEPIGYCKITSAVVRCDFGDLQDGINCYKSGKMSYAVTKLWLIQTSNGWKIAGIILYDKNDRLENNYGWKK